MVQDRKHVPFSTDPVEVLPMLVTAHTSCGNPVRSYLRPADLARAVQLAQLQPQCPWWVQRQTQQQGQGQLAQQLVNEVVDAVPLSGGDMADRQARAQQLLQDSNVGQLQQEAGWLAGGW